MSEIYIEWAKADGLLSDLDNSASRISTAARRVSGEANMWCMNSSAGRRISASIRDLGESLNQDKQDIAALRKSLNRILRYYGRCENGLLGMKDEILSLMAGLVGDLSGTTKAISAITGFITGIVNGDDLAEVLLNLAKQSVGSAADLLKTDPSAKWHEKVFNLGGSADEFAKNALENYDIGLPEDLVHAGDLKSAIKMKPMEMGWNTLKEAAKDELGGWKFWGKDLGAKARGAAICKWAGAWLDTALNGLENYQEFGGWSKRMVGETILESAVDIGLGAVVGIAVGAGVSAIAAAGVTVMAPAVIVGAVSGVAVWGINQICSHITGGKDLGEVAADAVCDKLENLGEAADRLWKNIKQTIHAGVGQAVPMYG